MIRRSRNSYMRLPRKVTLQPSGMPSRTLNCAIDFFALVITGFWPAMACSSATAPWILRVSAVVSPTPILITIFSSFGTAKSLP